MNSIAKRYVSWEKFAIEVGYVPLAKETVKLIFEKLDKTDIKEIAHTIGSTIPREFLMLTFGNTGFANVLLMLEIWSSRYGNVKHDINSNAHTFSLLHGINSNFSLFYCSLLEAMAKDLTFSSQIISTNSNLVSFNILENS
jgi:hypothetical protein